jgi:hypothetical protein
MVLKLPARTCPGCTPQFVFKGLSFPPFALKLACRCRTQNLCSTPRSKMSNVSIRPYTNKNTLKHTLLIVHNLSRKKKKKKFFFRFFSILRSDIKVHAGSSMEPMSSIRMLKNQLHESLVSASTTAYAIGNISAFPSFPMAHINWPPRCPFKWHASTDTMGLHPDTHHFLHASIHTYILWKNNPSF